MQLHRDAYATAEADAKKVMMAEFIVGYIMGNAEIGETDATTIYASARPTPAKPKGKGVRTADEQACYKRGYAKWLYHVVDAAPKLPKKAKPTQEVSYRFTPECGKAAAATRMRLAQTQNIVCVAEMSNGALFSTKAEVKVTIGGCGG